jgi:hypothetical protein
MTTTQVTILLIELGIIAFVLLVWLIISRPFNRP